jgi:hypothetical protein
MTPHRYYCLYRPPSLGTLPRRPVDVEDYGGKRLEPSIDRWVWGWVEYIAPLTKAEMEQYELIPGKETL